VNVVVPDREPRPIISRSQGQSGQSQDTGGRITSSPSRAKHISHSLIPWLRLVATSTFTEVLSSTAITVRAAWDRNSGVNRALVGNKALADDTKESERSVAVAVLALDSSLRVLSSRRLRSRGEGCQQR